MKLKNGVSIGRFIHANRMPLVALLGLMAIAACAVGGASLVGPPDSHDVSSPPTSVSVIAARTRLTTASTLPLRAVALDASGDTLAGASFTWNTSDARVATVSSTGMVTAVKAGTASITATTGSVTSGAVTITVVDTTTPPDTTTHDTTVVKPVLASLTISAPANSLAKNATLQATIVAHDTKGNVMTGVTVTWTSSDALVATVDANGKVTGVGPGSANITAKSGAITSNALALTVTSPPGNGPVATITVSAPSSSLSLLETLQAQAEARDSSGHVLQGITFTWASSNALAATVSNSGLITARVAGTTEITAKADGVTSAPFTVTVTVLP